MEKKSPHASHSNYRAGLSFALGNLETLMEYIQRDVSDGRMEAQEAVHFLSGPYKAMLDAAQTDVSKSSLHNLAAAFLDADIILRAIVRLCQTEYCCGKGVPFRAIEYWDFTSYTWLKDALPEYHPVHHELKQLLASLRPTLGDAAIDNMHTIVETVEKEILRCDTAQGATGQIKGLQAELSGKLDDNVRLDDATDLPVVDLVEALLIDAAKRGAREVEVLPGPWRGLIRYRIGAQEAFLPICEVPLSVLGVMVVRLKILAALDIANCSEAQEGRIAKMPSPVLVGRKIRVGTTPTPHREKVLIRLE